ncbi:hypothetical protein A0H81_07036 [Grifola frondosa]|uniref:F-box domain-containing protein n=1 Tax=Grifola frondosa TaxID=5627 RepID=A0A1C7M8W9_GRIFR|nr:hypothetical protein A0H81_07036 [Grifola frondosa]
MLSRNPPLMSCGEAVPPHSTPKTPTTVCSQKSHQSAPRLCHPQRRSSSHVWARFPQYARRVRILTYMCLGCIDASVWAALLRQNNGEPLLPRLHTLEWYGASTNDKSFQYFISKPLRNLTMHMRIKVEPIYDYSEMNISPTVAQPISEAAPLLETLHVEDYLRRPLEFLTPFTRLTALREITFDDDIEVTPWRPFLL